MTDEEFLQQFDTQTLPLEQWDHRAHLRVAYLYLSRLSFEEALVRVRCGIRAYNAAQHIGDTPTGGYHETMTHAWLHLVHVTLSEFGPMENSDQFLTAQSQLLSKRALLLFYSRDRIMSAEAKKTFVAPDLAPLPKSSKARQTKKEAAAKANHSSPSLSYS
ncbi:hypothetical protein [Brevifollis gellanilyticus]|uniref:Uncharacterized protein n=1 Tax=Brevifollis gellanilyticus TaxID=748831 RepID=A0A512MBC0_9BACT|nr:hypothetical protein [Brevifollis gellanilyticus]GEP44030.1 hypothetical protein BGE01nite_33210 [Brevifollis gellanilyticus]